MLIRRKYMTLLEMMIALSLTTLLLTILTYFYHEFHLINIRTEKLQTESFFSRYAQNRLSEVFSSAQPEYNVQDPFYFFTSKDPSSLIFIFNNGMKDRGSDLQLARLFVNKDNQLILISWPISSKWQEKSIPEKGHQEILMENVEKITFSFFIPPERDRSKVKENLSQSAQKMDSQNLISGQWVAEWSQEYQHLPPLIKLFIKKTGENEPITYSFVLPLSQKILVDEGFS